MRTLVATALLILLAGCGDSASRPETGSDPTRDPATEPAPVEGPPPFRVRYDDTEVAVPPHTYCYGNGCIDGIADPTDIGSPRSIEVFVPVPEFELSASASTIVDPSAELGMESCGGRTFALPVEELDDGWYRVAPGGPKGEYNVSLFASGDGDMIADLHWRTPLDGPLPAPSAQLALIADNDGEPDSYGLELGLQDLAATPTEVSAAIGVTAGNGESMTIRPEISRSSCQREGAVFFDRPDKPAKLASQLGPFPFTTVVTVTLDGVEHTATAVYPDDEIEGNEPSVALEFEPPLPGHALATD